MDNGTQKKKSRKKKDDVDNVIGVLDNLFTQGMIGEAFELVHHGDWSSENDKETGWKIVDLVEGYMKNGFVTKSHSQYELSALILRDIAKKLDGQEALPKFMAYIENTTDVRFVYSLLPIQVCLQNIVINRGHWLGKCFCLVQKNLITCHPLPNDNEVREEYECPSYYLNNMSSVTVFVTSITYAYKHVRLFYEPFLTESARGTKNMLPKRVAEVQKKLLIAFLLQMMGTPLMYLDLQDRGVKSEARNFIEVLILDFTMLVGDCFKFFANAEQGEIDGIFNERDEYQFFLASDNRNNHIPTLSVAHLYYMLLVEEIHMDKMPCVYNPIYIWMNSMYLTIFLISHEEDYNHIVGNKGLLLFKKVTSQFKDLSIPHQVLEAKSHKMFIRALAMLDANAKDNDIKTLITECLNLYIFKLDFKGRYLVLFNIVLDIKTPNFVAKLTTMLLTILTEALKTVPMTEFFAGEYLFNLLSCYSQINQVANNDIVDSHSQIVETLKVLQFLYTKDSHNASGIRKYSKYFETKFLDPLNTAILKYRAEYETRLKDLEYCLALGPIRKTVDFTESMKVWISSGEMARETKEMITDVSSKLNRFDVVDYWLARVMTGPGSDIETQFYIARTYNIGAKAVL